ncbi:hypothetical protein BX666DRAFT_1949378 [Dichotomocladium elegans]|nr:hypothetical protein BX666DRAFT_1949378 [Dichotomocladium elegans]
MQAPQRVTAPITTYNSSSLQMLPSPVSDRGTMVALPSNPSSPRMGSPSDSTYGATACLSTPVTLANDDTETPSSTPSKRNIKSHVVSACKIQWFGLYMLEMTKTLKRCEL